MLPSKRLTKPTMMKHVGLVHVHVLSKMLDFVDPGVSVSSAMCHCANVTSSAVERCVQLYVCPWIRSSMEMC